MPTYSDKKFSSKDNLEYDLMGKATTVVALSRMGSKVEVIATSRGPKSYGVDLKVKDKDGFEYYCDAEIKNFWSEHEPAKMIKEDGIDIPYRKKKLLNLDMPCFFAVVNKILSRLALVDSRKLKGLSEDGKPSKYNTYIAKKDTKYSKGGLFLRTPLDQLSLIDVNTEDHLLLSQMRKEWGKFTILESFEGRKDRINDLNDRIICLLNEHQEVSLPLVLKEIQNYAK